MAASAMQRSISKMIVREDEVEQRAALEEEKARRERAKKLRREASRKRYLERKKSMRMSGSAKGLGKHRTARVCEERRTKPGLNKPVFVMFTPPI